MSIVLKSKTWGRDIVKNEYGSVGPTEVARPTLSLEKNPEFLDYRR